MSTSIAPALPAGQRPVTPEEYAAIESGRATFIVGLVAGVGFVRVNA